jgi:hopene-associated glycosyltransferase HpnB
MIYSLVACGSLLLWIYLLCARGGYWTTAVRDDEAPPQPSVWPPVAVVIPARNEAEFIVASVTSLLRQNYPGSLAIIVVDDDSSDGTGALVRGLAAEAPAGVTLSVLQSRGLPPGWTGKLWAVKQGVAAAEALPVQPQFLLLTDADIVHAPDSLVWLVAHAVSRNLVQASFMAKLRCQTLAERSHVPAFVYFFQMLFPFDWVNRGRDTTAAAAGGCNLVRTDALRAAGGIDAIRNALIDDCALAAKLKSQGPIWLGLSDRVQSLRAYETMAEASQLASRSAYAQLRYSLWVVAGTIAAMTLVFLAPPMLAVLAQGPARWLAFIAWLAMASSFQPILRFYRLSPLWGVILPVIAFLYTSYTLESAYQYARSRGGRWKGRVYLNVPSLR